MASFDHVSSAYLPLYTATAISATPIRIITLTGNGPVENLNAFESLPAKEIAQSLPLNLAIEAGVKAPCHGQHLAPYGSGQHKGQGSSSFFPGPIGALLSRLGINRGSHEEHRHGWHSHSESSISTGRHRLFDALREHMEDVQGKIVPLMEGGMVKILPIMNENSEDGFASVEDVDERQDEHHHRHGDGEHSHHGHAGPHGHHGHHRHHKAHSFGGR